MYADELLKSRNLSPETACALQQNNNKHQLNVNRATIYHQTELLLIRTITVIKFSISNEILINRRAQPTFF